MGRDVDIRTQSPPLQFKPVHYATTIVKLMCLSSQFGTNAGGVIVGRALMMESGRADNYTCEKSAIWFYAHRTPPGDSLPGCSFGRRPRCTALFQRQNDHRQTAHVSSSIGGHPDRGR